MHGGKCCWGSSETSVAADTTLRQPSHTHARMTKPAGAWHALFATRLPRHGYRVPFPHLAYMTEPSSLSHISDSCINMQSGETKCKRETARGVKGDDDASQKVIPRDTKKCTAASVSSPVNRLVLFLFRAPAEYRRTSHYGPPGSQSTCVTAVTKVRTKK